MTTTYSGTLDEAYERLHATGPEFDGWLSNHGPMAAEVIVRHGHADAIGHWLDGYMRRLEEFPRGLGPIGTDWQAALGDPRRVADWTAYFRSELGTQPWRQVLGTWWPRLLPGVAAAATHGVIRVGHAVRVLLTDGDDEVRITELAHGLAYWAARWQTVPAGHRGALAAAAYGQARATVRSVPAPTGTDLAAHGPRGSAGDRPTRTALEALAAVPRIADQSGGIRDRLGRLANLPSWPPSAGYDAAVSPEQARTLLTGLVDAATLRYLAYGYGNGVMLVHCATAPNAVLRTLPALDPELWAPSLAAAWTAASALTAVYAPPHPDTRAELLPPADPAPPRDGALPDDTAQDNAVQEAVARAVEHGDAHVIKFTDTAVEVYARTGDPRAIAAARRDPRAIAAARRAAELIQP
jgi:hypothetical protein